MTQLDLPPISFARYLDLLKRKRWQVVPVSLLGLLIGGVVAFFIPRYYVCETRLEFYGDVLGVDPNARDPMAPVVESAKVTIPLSAGATLKDLGWPEVDPSDVDGFRALEQEVRSRIEVTDWRDDKGDRIAHVRIKYRDTDGERAKDFTNRLRDVWRDGQTEELRQRAAKELKDVSERIRRETELVRNLDNEIVTFQRDNHFDPGGDWSRRENGRSQAEVELDSVRKDVTQLTSDVAATEIELRHAIEAKQGLQATKLVDAKTVIPDETKKAMALATLEIARYTQSLANAKPNHPEYRYTQARLQAAKAKLAELTDALGIGDKVEVENPAFTAAAKHVEEVQTRLDTTNKRLELAKQRLTQLEQEAQERPRLWRNYNDLNERRELAQNRKSELVERRGKMEDKMQRLTDPGPFKVSGWASVPPRPTEPNISLVALAGSAVGLAVAIGLILLMDVLQSTYKTIDDVQRGLPVPVLGGISHMVTDEQRRAVTARRTRSGVAAAVFLLLTLSLITIYYVAPTRLPPMVRDTLDVILGAPVESPK